MNTYRYTTGIFKIQKYTLHLWEYLFKIPTGVGILVWVFSQVFSQVFSWVSLKILVGVNTYTMLYEGYLRITHGYTCQVFWHQGGYLYLWEYLWEIPVAGIPAGNLWISANKHSKMEDLPPM